MWKSITDFEELYEINDIGAVRNKTNMSLLSSAVCNSGYLKVHLYKNNKCFNKYVHRLVAETFIPNLNNYPCVNHKDGNKLNNNVNNLEWCSYSKNNYHAYKHGLKTINENTKEAMKQNGIKRRKAVIQYDINNNFICEWESIKQIHIALGYSMSNISRCCRGKQEFANGYKWAFKEKNDYE